MKKLNIVLAVVAIVALVFACVFGVQKGDLQKKVDELNAQVETVKKEAAEAASKAEAAVKEAEEKAAQAVEEAKKAAEEAAAKAAEEAKKAEEEAAAKAAEEAKKAEEEAAAKASEVPEGYPAIIEGLDFGGRTVYIYDWWSTDDPEHTSRSKDPDPDLAKTYEYRDWLEKTYNVKIVETALPGGGWEANPQALSNWVMNKENDEWHVIAVAGDFAGAALKNGLYAPWLLDMTMDNWNPPVVQNMTKDGVCYGVNTGKNEPRNVIYFNKTVLQDAGIDPESIYDLQAKGEWTWDKMIEIMQKVQRDVDNDDIMDYYGLTGSADTLLMGLIFSNNASVFDTNEEGKLVITANSDAALEAIQMRKDMWDNYGMPQPEGSQWDWFKTAWMQGKIAFYAGETWQGLGVGGGEMKDMQDERGVVAFPKGPRATEYITYLNNNVYGIPNVYDEETLKKIEQIFYLYRLPTPGVDSDVGWINDMYEWTDERGVETYGMLRELEHGVSNKVLLVGGLNDLLGNNFMWALGNGTPEQVVEAASPAWQDQLDLFNGDKTQEQIDAEHAAAEAAAAEAAAAAAAAEEAAAAEDAAKEAPAEEKAPEAPAAEAAAEKAPEAPAAEEKAPEATAP